MNDYCHIVPWYNTAEWQQVYEELSELSSNRENALNTLLVWKARCPFLPSGIESTLSLLQVQVQDAKHEDITDDQLVRLAYSSAVMRFVNHMLDTEIVKGCSLYQAAKNLGVPDWIVDLRHDAAHSNNLPCLALLREACTISLQWLQQNYWDKYKHKIRDYISGTYNVYDGDKDQIAVLINLCTSLSICAQTKSKIKNLSDIPDIDMRESILNDVNDLFGDEIDLSNPKTASIAALINHINNKNMLNMSGIGSYINEAILGEDSVFLSQELLYFCSGNDFKHKNKLNNKYLKCFEILLTFLHKNDLILGFLLSLIKITQDRKSTHFKARLAALWVSEILVALKRCQEFSERFQKFNGEKKHLKKKKDLEHLYYHWFPSTKQNKLILDLQKPVPSQLLDIHFIQPLIAAYNPYLIYFIRNLLDLIEPTIPTSVAERVYKLAELISSPEKISPTGSTTIYTVDDIKMSNEDDDDDVEIVEIEPEQVQDTRVWGIWKLASKNHEWSSSPIGQLPWKQIHSTKDINTEMEINQN